MKILFCIDHLRADGTQRVLCQLVAGLAARGHRLTVVCLNDSLDEALVRELCGYGAQLRVVGRRALAGIYGLIGLAWWARAERFDVAVTMLFAADVIGRLVARAAGVPRIVSSIRARNINYRLWQLWLVRATMPLADCVIVNSRASAPFAAAAEGVPPARLLVIPNAIDPAPYARPYPPAELRAQLGLAPGRRLLACVGRLTPQKGQDLLLHALGQLGMADIDLLLIGEGEDEAKLRDLAAQLGIAGQVHFTGYRRDVSRILGTLDLYVHPARFEGMPNALLEAMAAGCPIVASAADGSRELITDGLSGWLVPVGNVERLAQAIGAALNDPAAARRRGAHARARAVAHYSLQAMISAWERILVRQ